MSKTVPMGQEPSEIGRRARVIRRLRGLSGDVVAGLTGISEEHLSMLVLGSQERSSKTHLDLARALVQDSADRDAEAIRHLDTADRLGSQRIRMNPVTTVDCEDVQRRRRSHGHGAPGSR